ncbi:MAG: lipoprotein [Gammaproteobacteria bacterium]|jgi:predicted small lipoprotein YifL
MKPILRAALATPLLLSLALAGCGQKGPLYLPDEPQAPAVQPTDG